MRHTTSTVAGTRSLGFVCLLTLGVASGCASDPAAEPATPPPTIVPEPTTPVRPTTTTTTTTTTTDPPTTIPTIPTIPTTTPYRVPLADAASAGWNPTHAGYPATDLFIDCGAEIVAPVNGSVLEVRTVDEWDPAVDDPATRGGRSVAVLGDDGVRYYVAHLDDVDVALVVGERVEIGQRLGTVGRTGRTSACHVHFAISPPCPGPEWSIRRGVIAPAPYLDAWRAGEQRSPAPEVQQWVADHPTACADAMADPGPG